MQQQAFLWPLMLPSITGIAVQHPKTAGIKWFHLRLIGCFTLTCRLKKYSDGMSNQMLNANCPIHSKSPI